MIDPKQLNGEPAYRYQLLGRLKNDCEAYIEADYPRVSRLWAQDPADQIEAMRTLWNSFPDGEKPQWLSAQDIDRFEAHLCPAEPARERPKG